MIRVAVAGALGRMGSEVIRAVSLAEDMELVAAVDVPQAVEKAPSGVAYLISSDLKHAVEQAKPEVLVDFTVADAACANAITALGQGVRPVIGTTGMSADQLGEIEAKAKGVGAFIAPNFAIGAVLMGYFAKIGARYFDSAEIIELHHDQKIDAPSGTAFKMAQDMARERGKAFATNVPEKEAVPGGRGAEWEGLRLHSVRLPGLVAHHEVIFGAQGQILTLRHDSTDRTSFMPGVLIAIREVMKLDKLVVGLDNLLSLS